MTEDAWVRVATLGAPHGLHGDVRLRVHTDDPDGRLVVGRTFPTQPADGGPLELAAVARRQGTVLARFVGHEDRTAAERLRGLVLLAEPEDEDDAWYPEQLVGLAAQRPDGTRIGTIAGVQHLPAQDVLVLLEPDGTRTLVPFVTAIVPEVDVEGGVVVVDPPSGLLAADAAAEPDDHDGSTP